MTNQAQTAKNQKIDIGGTSFTYREIGKKGGIPVIFLHHLTAVLDDWDPRLVNSVAADHHVVMFDNRGLGSTGGKVPATVADMASDAITFIKALGFSKVDLFGFSLGGFVAQEVAHQAPQLVRKIVLTGTGPAGGEGIENVAAVLQDAIEKTNGTGRHPKHILFFSQSERGQKGADEFLARLAERTEDLDTPVTMEAIGGQLSAIHAWGTGPKTDLESLQHPVLIANGDVDVMVPTVNSWELFQRLPNATLSIFPDAGHGGIFEYAEFLEQLRSFLAS